MNKFIALAACLGLASASYGNQASPRVVLDYSPWFKLQYDYDFDWTWSTFFDMGPVSGKPELYFEKFSVNMTSSAEVGFSATFFDFYKYDIRTEFTPFDITPLIVTLRVVRPDAMIFSGSSFDFNIQLGYRIKLLEMSPSTTVNMKGIKRSFVNWIKDLTTSSNPSYTIYPSSLSHLDYHNKPTTYEDSFYSFSILNLLNYIVPSSSLSWYGDG